MNDAQRLKSSSMPWYVGGGILAVLLGGMLGLGNPMIALALVAVLGLLLVFFWPNTLYVVVLASMVLGQLIRIPVPGSDQFFLPNDVLIPVLMVFWFLRQAGTKKLWLPRTSITLPLLLMPLIMVLSLLVNVGRYDSSVLLSGFLYIVRWVEYASLFFVTAQIVHQQRRGWRIIVGMTLIGVTLALLGFVQLKVFPDFSFMAPKGWDPHIGRLLSTWFDPNFLGGFFAAVLGLTLSIALNRGRRGVWWWVASALIVIASVLTFSRSGYVALAVAVGVVTLVRSRLLLYLGLLGLVATFLFVPRVQERVLGIRSVDETAQLRIVSWENAWTVIQQHPILGSGYNVYREAQLQAGITIDPNAHSSTGSDSSLLLLTATTGVVGLAVYLWLLVAMLCESVRTMINKKIPSDWRAVGLGVTAGVLALILHSQFVNSLLFPHIMEYLWVVLGVVVAVRQSPPETV